MSFPGLRERFKMSRHLETLPHRVHAMLVIAQFRLKELLEFGDSVQFDDSCECFLIFLLVFFLSGLGLMPPTGFSIVVMSHL